jgi:hypothetical protein
MEFITKNSRRHKYPIAPAVKLHQPLLNKWTKDPSSMMAKVTGEMCVVCGKRWNLVPSGITERCTSERAGRVEVNERWHLSDLFNGSL